MDGDAFPRSTGSLTRPNETNKCNLNTSSCFSAILSEHGEAIMRLQNAKYTSILFTNFPQLDGVTYAKISPFARVRYSPMNAN